MNMSFADTLKRLRTEKGLLQQELAKKLSVTRSTVSRWENGSRLPDVVIISRIAEVLDVADKIAIFYGGSVVETARVSSFSGDGSGLKHPYSRALFHALPQNGFNLDRCPDCGATSATWNVDETGMRCACHA